MQGTDVDNTLKNHVNSNDVQKHQHHEDLNITLTGKTLLVYRYLVTCGKPCSAREIHRALNLSGPSIASFHLDKLVRSGLVRQNESDGAYVVDKLYLKHYFLLRQRLVPKYFLYATLATFSIVGWITTLFLRGSQSSNSYPFLPLGGSPADFYVFIYGVSLSILFAGIFWRETLQVLKNEKI